MFCSNNILYPREDRDQKILLYACRNCDHQEIADDNCVYRNEVHHSVAERTQVLQDVAADPTLPRTKAVTCTVCKHPEAVFFQLHSIRSFSVVAGIMFEASYLERCLKHRSENVPKLKLLTCSLKIQECDRMYHRETVGSQ
ncbi:DNA-DIRECTED RNA polymerase SUBUNIT [Salix koriyanagi]|uniref:DNA-DIRECTED RNA polymerase SUBUNIT n=1 Tax=Salix koriyanagi TaxID=2511006 RepID=A0A9Q0WM93_9ROSI|nr:DNA-DIRECTED RNA polymerase SUBUNIT [Salix koriyanagi]